MSSVELHKIDFGKFIEALDQCKGNVWLVTDEGDSLLFRFNLYGDKILREKEAENESENG